MTQPADHGAGQCMLDDMKLRDVAASTRKVYVFWVAGFSAFTAARRRVHA